MSFVDGGAGILAEARAGLALRPKPSHVASPPGDRTGTAACEEGDDMIRIADLHEKWSRDPAYRAAYDRLGPAFEVARALIEARSRAGLTQSELAERMETTQSVVARLESGRARPSTRTLEKFARATGTRLRIAFDPE